MKHNQPCFFQFGLVFFSSFLSLCYFFPYHRSFDLSFYHSEKKAQTRNDNNNDDDNRFTQNNTKKNIKLENA